MATSQVLEGMIISSSGEAGEIVVRAQERPSSFKSKSCVSVEWWSGASAWEIGMRISSTPSLSAEMTMMAVARPELMRTSVLRSVPESLSSTESTRASVCSSALTHEAPVSTLQGPEALMRIVCGMSTHWNVQIASLSFTYSSVCCVQPVRSAAAAAKRIGLFILEIVCLLYFLIPGLSSTGRCKGAGAVPI